MTDLDSIQPPPSFPPPWYPRWAVELADLYFSGTVCLFVLHGNVHDLVRGPAGDESGYGNLAEFLATQVFGSWDVVLQYDLGKGLRPLAGPDAARLKTMVAFLSSHLGDSGAWPRDPDSVLLMLDKLIDRNIMADQSRGRKSIAVILDHAQYLAPAGDLGSLARGHSTNLVRLLGWAQNPYIKRLNTAFCLISEKLSEVNQRLVQNPHVAAIEIPMPGKDERERFVSWATRGATVNADEPFSPVRLAELSNGLTLVSLNSVLTQTGHARLASDDARFKQLKKQMIERQCQGLLEFIEPGHGLDLVVGQEAAKQRLREDADLIGRGLLDSAPMGYLICGPVGTGKTFLAECFAGSIGIPCVKLRNFRSKYVGETEGNLEQVLTVLRSLGPVVVIIDEADAALGTRQADGDSGTSSRVFSMIASQMGDTRYRGRIVWMLLTSRPDLLPIDLKRQGRAEVHIPLFYPQDEQEIQRMLSAMARKNKVRMAGESWPALAGSGETPLLRRNLSGADIESILLSAKRQALTAGRHEVAPEDIEAAAKDFIPSAQGMEKELQELSAVLECTQISFLPPAWQSKVAQPEGRSELQKRRTAIRQWLEQ